MIVDASVAVRILSREPGADEALRRVLAAEARCAPDWIRLEVASAMARKVREGVIAEADALATATGVTTLVEEQVDSFGLLNNAFALSVRLKHPLYDCLYLALAERLDGVMLTTDRKFVSSGEQAGFGHCIELLA